MSSSQLLPRSRHRAGLATGRQQGAGRPDVELPTRLLACVFLFFSDEGVHATGNSRVDVDVYIYIYKICPSMDCDGDSLYKVKDGNPVSYRGEETGAIGAEQQVSLAVDRAEQVGELEICLHGHGLAIPTIAMGKSALKWRSLWKKL